MSSPSNTSLILHVKGTVDETKTLPKHAVRAAIADGKISRSQLIWSPTHNAWKQVRELPHLWPSQQLAPPPAPRTAAGAVPLRATRTIPRIAATSQPRVASSPSPEKVRVAVTAQATPQNYRVTEKSHFHPMKWFCLVLGFLILAIMAVNFLLVEQPLLFAMNRTPYSKVWVYAHFGGFVQRDALVIHILGSSSLDQSNLTDFLVTLAHNTPQQAGVFERVALTSGFMGQYTLSGSAWKEFGDMQQASEGQRKDFLLRELGNASGDPLISLNPTVTAESQGVERKKIWTEFVARLTHS